MKSKPTALPVTPENIPLSMQAIDRWVLWRYELREGSWSKVPKQVGGRNASTRDPQTWTSFEDARDALETGEFSGLGLVIPEGVVGVDLDDVRDPESGELSEHAKMLMARLPSYCEVSPSGTGVKLLVAGNVNRNLKKVSHERGIEIYDGGDTNRYFALTGERVGDIAEITGQREGIHAIQTMLDVPYEYVAASEDTQLTRDRMGDAKEFLAHLKDERADSYSDWINVGMVLHWCGPDSPEMLELWKEWSSKSDKYVEEDCDYRWKSFHAESDGRLVTLGWLKRIAIEDGYNPNQFDAEWITGQELLAKVITREYLIENFFVKNEPMIVGGAAKSLKTSVSLEMAVSISTGHSFLDRFDVPVRHRVGFLSGESGEGTLQENLAMMTAAKGISPEKLDILFIGFRLPQLADPECVDSLLNQLHERQIDVLFIDPLYRSLDVGDGASNVFSMGKQFQVLTDQVHKSGISVVLLHHFKKQGRSYNVPPELEDLSQSGIAEYGRQFLLLKRKAKYEWDGNHSLWFSYGGSAGHQGNLVLDVHTGTRKLGLDWRTALRTESEWQKLQEEKKAREKEEKGLELRERILEFVANNPHSSGRTIRDVVGGRAKSVVSTLGDLVDEGSLFIVKGPRNASLYTTVEGGDLSGSV